MSVGYALYQRGCCGPLQKNFVRDFAFSLFFGGGGVTPSMCSSSITNYSMQVCSGNMTQATNKSCFKGGHLPATTTVEAAAFL